jgi:uncharacterized membrane protein (DUF485 family)
MSEQHHTTAPEASSSHNSRYGLALFGVYVALYAGFIGLAVFNAPLLGSPFLGGVNLAIVYGFFLIAAALLMALAYMALCKDPAEAHHHAHHKHGH